MSQDQYAPQFIRLSSKSQPTLNPTFDPYQILVRQLRDQISELQQTEEDIRTSIKRAYQELLRPENSPQVKAYTILANNLSDIIAKMIRIIADLEQAQQQPQPTPGTPPTRDGLADNIAGTWKP